jgi:hypothetical protein
MSRLGRLLKLSQVDRLLELMILRMAVAIRLRRGSAVANLALSVAE